MEDKLEISKKNYGLWAWVVGVGVGSFFALLFTAYQELNLLYAGGLVCFVFFAFYLFKNVSSRFGDTETEFVDAMRFHISTRLFLGAANSWFALLFVDGVMRNYPPSGLSAAFTMMIFLSVASMVFVPTSY